MKRLVSLFLILAVLTSSFLFAGGSTAFASDDVWVKDFRRDAFGDPTDEWIITNSELFSGTFNGDAADSAPLSPSKSRSMPPVPPSCFTKTGLSG